MGVIIKNGIPYVGGVGNNSIELTQAEYDALPEKDQLDGTVYYITDGTGSSGGSSSGEISNMRYDQTTDMIQIKDAEGVWHNYASGGLSYKALIPTLTSYTGNNGSCIYSSELSTSYLVWYAFDYGDSTVGATGNATTNYIGYQWNNNISAKGVEARFAFLHGEAKTITFKLQYYDGSDWVDITDSEKTHTFSTQNMSIQLNWSLPDYIDTNGIRIYSTCSTGHATGYYNIQVYGKNVI